MDQADTAAKVQQDEIDRGIAAARRQLGSELAYTGFCRWCGDPVAEPKRFCDADCGGDFEKWQRRGEP